MAEAHGDRGRVGVADADLASDGRTLDGQARASAFIVKDLDLRRPQARELRSALDRCLLRAPHSAQGPSRIGLAHGMGCLGSSEVLGVKGFAPRIAGPGQLTYLLDIDS